MRNTNTKVIEIVKDKLVEAYQPETIYLFGSFAWGNPDEESDIDLLVIIEHSDEKPYRRARIGIEFLSGLKIPKDILVYTREEFENLAQDFSTLCHKVKKEGIKLYEAA
jgi:predicted nucleotidyltransferase